MLVMQKIASWLQHHPSRMMISQRINLAMLQIQIRLVNSKYPIRWSKDTKRSLSKLVWRKRMIMTLLREENRRLSRRQKKNVPRLSWEKNLGLSLKLTLMNYKLTLLTKRLEGQLMWRNNLMRPFELWKKTIATYKTIKNQHSTLENLTIKSKSCKFFNIKDFIHLRCVYNFGSTRWWSYYTHLSKILKTRLNSRRPLSYQASRNLESRIWSCSWDTNKNKLINWSIWRSQMLMTLNGRVN